LAFSKAISSRGFFIKEVPQSAQKLETALAEKRWTIPISQKKVDLQVEQKNAAPLSSTFRLGPPS
jgi:hypothetical protein